MKRRRLLAAVGTSSVALAGCLGGMPEDAVIAAEPSTPTADAAELAAADLPSDERTVVRRAVDQGFYHACPELPDAVRSFADRLGEETYLLYRNDSYGLWVRVGDAVYAWTADPPEADPSCGVL